MRRDRIDLSAAAIAVLAAIGGLRIRAAESEGPLELKVVAGFEGIVWYDEAYRLLLVPHLNLLPLTIEVTNRGKETQRADLLVRGEGDEPARIGDGLEIAAGSTVRRRVVLSDADPPIEVIAASDGGRISKVVERGDLRWVPFAILAVDERPRGLRAQASWAKNPIPVATCRSAYLPEEVLAYNAIVLAILGDTDPSSWSPGQVKAIEEYARSGGTIVLNASPSERALLASPAVGRWLATRIEPRVILTAGGTPILCEIPFGLGRIVTCTIDLFEPAERDDAIDAISKALLGPFREIVDEGPWQARHSLMPHLVNPFIHPVAEEVPGDSSGVSVVAGAFGLYAILIALAGAFALRRRRLSAVLPATAAVVAFTAAMPAVLALLDRPASPAAAARVCAYGPEGTGIEAVCVSLQSAGTGGKSFTIRGKDVWAYAPAAPDGAREGSPLLPFLVRRDPNAASLDIPTERWEGGWAVGFCDPLSPPPLRVRAVMKAGVVEVTIEKNPDWDGPVRFESRAPEDFPVHALRALRILWGARRDVVRESFSMSLVSRSSAYLLVWQERVWASEFSLMPLLRGEAIIVRPTPAPESSRDKGPSSRVRSPCPSVRDGGYAVVRYFMPEDTGTRVDGDDFSWQPGIRLVEQYIRIEEER